MEALYRQIGMGGWEDLISTSTRVPWLCRAKSERCTGICCLNTPKAEQLIPGLIEQLSCYRRA